MKLPEIRPFDSEFSMADDYRAGERHAQGHAAGEGPDEGEAFGCLWSFNQTLDGWTFKPAAGGEVSPDGGRKLCGGKLFGQGTKFLRGHAHQFAEGLGEGAERGIANLHANVRDRGR